MKNIARKTQNQKNNVLSLINNSKFKVNQDEINIKRAKGELHSYQLNQDVFLFQKGDTIICRHYIGEDLPVNTMVVAQTETSDKILTTVANAVEILSIIVAYRREVFNG